MKVLALDLANLSGWAMGSSRSSLLAGRWDFRGEHPAIVPGKIGYALRALFKEHGAPEFMAIEKTLPPFAQKHQAVICAQERAHGAALGAAGMFCIPRVEEFLPATIRKYFIGRANFGDREATKAAVMRRCKQLGYKAADDNVGDALALWDFVTYAVLKKPGEKFALFGE